MSSPLPPEFSLTEAATGLGSVCNEILRSVPEWFGIEESIVEYVEAIEKMSTILAMHGDQAIGFMTLERHAPKSGELHVLAIRPEWHRRGVGAALLAATESYAQSVGVRYLQVKTLSSRRECEHYAKTRLWYEAMGFEVLTEFPTLWGEDLPCLQLIKVL